MRALSFAAALFWLSGIGWSDSAYAGFVPSPPAVMQTGGVTANHVATWAATGGSIQDGGIAAPPCSAFGTTAGTCAQGNDVRLGAGAVTGAIKSNGSNTFGQAATTDLSDTSASTSCAITDNGGGALTFAATSCSYNKVGNNVCVSGTVTYPSTADTHPAAWAWNAPATANRGASGENTYITLISSYAVATLTLALDQNAQSSTIEHQLGLTTITNATVTGATFWFNGCYSES